MSASTHEAGADALLEAAKKAAQCTGNVMVTPRFESKPRHLKLRLDNCKPYVLVGFRSKHREYLTAYQVAYGGELVIFSARDDGRVYA
jgi:hypothetical protein